MVLTGLDGREKDSEDNIEKGKERESHLKKATYGIKSDDDAWRMRMMNA